MSALRLDRGAPTGPLDKAPRLSLVIELGHGLDEEVVLIRIVDPHLTCVLDREAAVDALGTHATVRVMPGPPDYLCARNGLPDEVGAPGVDDRPDEFRHRVFKKGQIKSEVSGAGLAGGGAACRR